MSIFGFQLKVEFETSSLERAYEMLTVFAGGGEAAVSDHAEAEERFFGWETEGAFDEWGEMLADEDLTSAIQASL